MRPTPTRHAVHLALAGVLAVTALAAPAVEATMRLTQAPRPVFFGITVPNNDFALLDRDAADAGARPTVDNIFVKLDSPDYTTAKLQGIGARGMRPMVSLEPWSYKSTWGQAALPEYRLATITAGRHDAALRRIARATAAYRQPVVLRFAHEMNGWWYPWAAGQNGNRPGDYIAAWRYVRTLFRREGASNARFLWAPNALTGSGRETRLELLYPGDAYVDTVGMTAYSHGASPADTFDATYARLSALTRKDIIIAETGVEGPGKAAWITAFGSWILKHSRVAGFVWFNMSPDTAGVPADYRFNETPEAANAFRTMLRGLRLSS